MDLHRSADQLEHGQREEKVRRHLKGKDEGKRYGVARESARKKAATMLPQAARTPTVRGAAESPGSPEKLF